MEKYHLLSAFLDSCSGSELEYVTDASLSDFSTFRIGGKADLAVFPLCQSGMIVLIDKLISLGIRYTVIGNGSNILFDDNGFKGVLVCTDRMKNVVVEDETIIAEAGASFTHLAVTAQKSGLSGLEFAYGIPGTVGGAVYMNAGAYDGETSQILLKSTYYDPKKNKVVTLSCKDHDFSYRHSYYMDKRYIILSAVFKLKKSAPKDIKSKMDDFMKRRREKQPLEYPSAGSTFKRYPGYYTAALIDAAGLKGYSVGGAQVSEKHAGFIINKGNATCRDVLELIGIIRTKIYETNGIWIETEIRYIV